MKRIVLVAHDNKKPEMVEWVKKHIDVLQNYELYATGTTGKLIAQESKLPVTRLQSGPLGGDQQIGAMIAEGKVDMLFFFWDPLAPQPHDPDVKALLRIAVVWNLPFACNVASADFLITSANINNGYQPKMPDFDSYISRKV
jgi:methylglyoxal synthase